ncbi:CHC2 zinc finger domain-containing protein [Marilutibacter aestuarii]|uniref:DNA primase n=1 Tax=Marilutibacter aestuarii TaxID=1706195 RepID=A0A508AVY6_9GAMM|nr:CHC2 zinc finger domain-containing protein [Lysobacter aestuarii]TQD51225.1 DNA primase [Lysobacter aestuarii]
MSRIDVGALRAQVDIVQVVGAYVDLKKDGREYKGRCPFHDERTPSFYVSPSKGFVHCFGCGAHHDVIDFLQRYENITFQEACARLGGESFRPSPEARPAQRAPQVEQVGGKWVPLMPVPDDAPELVQGDGWTVPVWNVKRGKFSRFKPATAFDYRDSQGRLIGYVLRCEFKDGKITPTVTWCIGPDGAMQWCIQPFPRPRPLFGLDALADRPAAPVLLSEGEKCRAAGADALPMYVSVSWAGGGKGVAYVDWSPLAERDVVLWPDADDAGRQAMLGHRDYAGRFHVGVAQLLKQAGVRSMRVVDPAGQPKGWDLADALAEGWTPRQLATWAAHRVAEIDVVRG